eukprot:1156674-Pelagomonas_calceolata.AAC.10
MSNRAEHVQIHAHTAIFAEQAAVSPYAGSLSMQERREKKEKLRRQKELSLLQLRTPIKKKESRVTLHHEISVPLHAAWKYAKVQN